MYRLFERASNFDKEGTSFHGTPMGLRLVIMGLTSKSCAKRKKAWAQLPALLA